MKERIIINGRMYLCPPGTNDKIKELIKKGDNSPGSEHEKGQAYRDYKNFLYSISDKRMGTFIDGIFYT